MTDENDFKEHLRSVSYYDYLDTNYNDLGDNTKCNLLSSKFPAYPNLHNFCMSLTGTLENFHNLKPLSLFEGDVCQYFNIWIYDRLLKQNIKMKNSECIPIFTSIMEYFKEFHDSNKCYYDFYSMLEMNFNKMKELYDYALDYRIIEHYVKKSENQCNDNNNSYIKHKSDVYSELRSKCTSYINHDYCVVFKHIDQIYEKDELLKLQCKPVISASQSRILGDGQLQRKAVMAENQDHLREQQPGHRDGYNSRLEPQDETSPLSFSSIPVAFTPFRIWICGVLKKKNITEHNLNDEEFHEFLGNSYEYTDMEFPSERQIGYHPS
ncbi:PIR Superfamily Protein [Plasmodium ovale wallikeri]|uniref:PIR Superfamily Protein n=1 Tax=Plasmodium ovale wallikeri TaxID=864142 RepID=A0A1A8YP63_PLAOA|nr:PIR Superfamily Protein [Plasmodium ovale wallikeri]SBT59115.1 PIR Superfamily Protein [Plasmodium ovale wallikeri]